MEQFKLKVGRCFALIFNHLGGFDLFVTGRRHFLLSERSLSFNNVQNVMITLTSARPSARTVELASVIPVGHTLKCCLVVKRPSHRNPMLFLQNVYLGCF